MTDNLYETITLGHSIHSRQVVGNNNQTTTQQAFDNANGGVGGNATEELYPSLYVKKDLSLPAAGQFATYPADPVLVRTRPRNTRFNTRVLPHSHVYRVTLF